MGSGWAWLELGGAWLKHGWGRRGLAGGKDLGGASMGLRRWGVGLQWGKARSLDPQTLPLEPGFSTPPFLGRRWGWRPSPSTRSRAQGPAMSRTRGSGARPADGSSQLIDLEANQRLLFALIFGVQGIGRLISGVRVGEDGWVGDFEEGSWRPGLRRGCPPLPPHCPPADSVEDEFELSTVCHRPEGLEQLQEQTKFTRKELQVLYRGFKNVSAKQG